MSIGKEKYDTLDKLLNEAYEQKIPLWKVCYRYLSDHGVHEHLIKQIFSYRDGRYELAKKLLSDDTCDVNEDGRLVDPPLVICARNADDDDNVGNEFVRIMELILQHPRCDVNARHVKTNMTALHWICERTRSVSGAMLLLQHKDIDLCKVDGNGNTALHLLIRKIGYKSFDKLTAILKLFLNHSSIQEAIHKRDKFGLSVLDRFLCNQEFHAYDLDVPESVRAILQILFRFKYLITASSKTLALAGTLCSPAVFRMLLENGASTIDSLEGETALHCVISRNSVDKCKSLLDRDPDLNTRWNCCDAVEMAKSHGCKNEIIRMLDAYKSANDASFKHKGINQRYDKVEASNSLSLEWSQFKSITTSKIRLQNETQSHLALNNTDTFSVKYSDFAMREYQAEIKGIKRAVRLIFDDISKQFADSTDCYHMKYNYMLCGSIRDSCKVYGPTEMDVVLELDSKASNGVLIIEELLTDPHKNIETQRLSNWRTHCNQDGQLYAVSTAQAFYKEFARKVCQYNDKIKKNNVGIVQVTFQFLSKISQLRITWKGNAFCELTFYVDIAVAFPFTNPEYKFPIGVKCSSFHAIAKADRHAFTGDTMFPVSFCEAETIVIQSLPEPLRQAFITAKAVRLSSVCLPGFEPEHFKIVEDLAIDEYISSHALKNCLLNILKSIWSHDARSEESPEFDLKDIFCERICKYVLADSIYAKYQGGMNKKFMHEWHNNYWTLFDCRGRCQKLSPDLICCRKREIKLALVHQIRKWLNNKDKLRYLHDGDECNCARSYSLAEMEYHWEYIGHLMNGRSPFEHMNTDSLAFQLKFGNKLITSPI